MPRPSRSEYIKCVLSLRRLLALLNDTYTDEHNIRELEVVTDRQMDRNHQKLYSSIIVTLLIKLNVFSEGQ